MKESLERCRLCPRTCLVNRIAGEKGFCQAGSEVKVARAALHHWEEPCLSGTRGSGTVFFSHCTLKCVFCQNGEISEGGFGKEIPTKRLVEIFLELQEKEAHNINLVTPTQYVPQIREALKEAKNRGLRLPIVYNSSGYESIEILQSLEGLIDIYLPDLKYYKDKYAIKYSKAKHYFEYASKAIDEMVRQVKEPIFDTEGMMQRGVIIRHLMLPGLLFDTKKIIEYIASHYGDQVYLSLMNQYTPLERVRDYKELMRTLNGEHYEYMVNYALELGIEKGFIQEGETAKESFIPAFNTDGV